MSRYVESDIIYKLRINIHVREIFNTFFIRQIFFSRLVPHFSKRWSFRQRLNRFAVSPAPGLKNENNAARAFGKLGGIISRSLARVNSKALLIFPLDVIIV